MDKKVIGIIGGAGSGKSEVLRIMKEKYNAQIIMADEVARELQKPGEYVYTQIVEAFGPDILMPDQTIDRKKLAQLVFNHKEQLNKLNHIVHPAVRREIEKIIGQSSSSTIVLEAALLVECGYRSLCDEFWYVYSDETIRRRRMKETRNYTDEKIDVILKNQLTEDAFIKNSDKIIKNNATLKALEKEIEKNFSVTIQTCG